MSRFRETTVIAALLKLDNKTALMEQQIANQLVVINSLHRQSDISRAALAKETLAPDESLLRIRCRGGLFFRRVNDDPFKIYYGHEDFLTARNDHFIVYGSLTEFPVCLSPYAELFIDFFVP